jgi:hypothetical protein
MQVASFLADHGVNIINTILMIAGFLIGKGYIKDKTIEKVYELAVAVAEQWKKNKLKPGQVVPLNTDVKQIAIDYLKRNLPAGVEIDNDKLEGMVYKVTKTPVVAPAPPAVGEVGYKPGWVENEAPIKPAERKRDATGKYI